MPLTTHVATLGAAGAGGALDAGATYFFKAYKGSYTGIKTQTGVDEASENQQDAPCYPVKELLAKGILVRVVVGIKDGTKNKTRRLLVTRDRVGAALEGLEKQPLAGGTIVSARIPRDATFY